MAQRHRRRPAAAADGLAWGFGVMFAIALRFEFMLDSQGWIATGLLALVAGVIQIAIGHMTTLHRGRFTYGSFDEVRAVALIVVLEAMLLSLIVIPLGPVVGIPRGSLLLALPFVLLLMFGVRYVVRLLVDHAASPGQTPSRP